MSDSDVFINWLRCIEKGDRYAKTLKSILNANDYSLVSDIDILKMYNYSKEYNTPKFYEEKQSLLIKSALYAGISEEEANEMILNLEESGWHFHPNIEMEISEDPNVKLSPEAINYVLKIVSKDEKMFCVSQNEKIIKI